MQLFAHFSYDPEFTHDCHYFEFHPLPSQTSNCSERGYLQYMNLRLVCPLIWFLVEFWHCRSWEQSHSYRPIPISVILSTVVRDLLQQDLVNTFLSGLPRQCPTNTVGICSDKFLLHWFCQTWYFKQCVKWSLLKRSKHMNHCNGCWIMTSIC